MHWLNKGTIFKYIYNLTVVINTVFNNHGAFITELEKPFGND